MALWRVTGGRRAIGEEKTDFDLPELRMLKKTVGDCAREILRNY
jgi:hypothetical protein